MDNDATESEIRELSKDPFTLRNELAKATTPYFWLSAAVLLAAEWKITYGSKDDGRVFFVDKENVSYLDVLNVLDSMSIGMRMVTQHGFLWKVESLKSGTFRAVLTKEDFVTNNSVATFSPGCALAHAFIDYKYWSQT
jgi:hypothetical protein